MDFLFNITSMAQSIWPGITKQYLNTELKLRMAIAPVPVSAHNKGPSFTPIPFFTLSTRLALLLSAWLVLAPELGTFHG